MNTTADTSGAIDVLKEGALRHAANLVQSAVRAGLLPSQIHYIADTGTWDDLGVVIAMVDAHLEYANRTADEHALTTLNDARNYLGAAHFLNHVSQ